MSGLIWSFNDEYRMMLELREAPFEEYVSAILTRTVDFEGAPVTSEWIDEFLVLADDARRARWKMAIHA